MDALPVEADPERGWVATANALTLPADFPIDEVRVGFEWTAPWREDRIAEVLAAGDTHRFADSVALQRDYVSLPARRIVAALSGVTPREEIDGRALALLREFDGDLRPESAAAALFEVWFSRHLRPAVSAALAGPEAAEAIGPADTRVTVRAVTRPGELLTTEARDNLVRSTLIAAWADVAGRLGWEPEDWRWGDLHRSHFVHPLAAIAQTRQPALAGAMALPDFPMGGSGETPNNTRYGRDDFLVRGGASFRMVLDVGEWDAARMTNTPGQSGRPGGEHYGDLLEPWAELDSLPLLYSREAVEAATVRRIELRPAP
jgi:penicillin amidase